MPLSYDPLTGLSLISSPARPPSPFRSKEIVVTLQTPERRVKIFRVDWLKSEVGVSAGFAYFSPSHAVLGRFELRVPPGGQGQISLLESGMVTSHPVKLSFHKSGAVLFSSDGKIISKIRTTSRPLLGGSNHLFTVYVRGPEGFKPAGPKDGSPPAPGRGILNIGIDEPGDVGCKVVGRWYPLSILKQTHSESGAPGRPNLVTVVGPSGNAVRGFLFSQVPTWPWGGFGLLLSVERWAIDGGHADPFVLVQGGFDPMSDPDGRDAGVSFLAGMYTDRSNEIADLTSRLGSVDYQSDV